MPASKSVKLNTGAEMPTLGFGTWKSQPGAVERAVEIALKHGYKHIDTATAYANESEVGKGIKASGVPRESFFLTTKLDNPDQKEPEKALFASLEKLETDYLDLWLMHWPAPMLNGSTADFTVNWLDTWKKMEELYKKYPEKIKAIGVSNISVSWMKKLLDIATVVPAVNQIELHPSCTQKDVLEFCAEKGISVTAYSPLGSDNSPLLTNEIVTEIAKAHNVTPANVLLSLQANKPNITVLSKSVTESRIISNLTIIDLSEEEVQKLEDIDKTAHFRVCNPNWTGWGSLGFPDCE
ncbi:NADP-dependent oxidoreductase domain-containing protein [Mucidula mucida]|nr:NADP-dependent oxidoreductase domain-containing protein [Mucidula mucida]